MIEITPGLSEYLKRDDGTLWHVPWFHCKQETTKFFFKYFWPAQKEMAKLPPWTKFADTCHLIITDSLFYPRGKKALTFSFDTDTFMAPRGPSVSVVMGGVRWGIYSRTALFQGGAYFKITFLTIWNLTLNQLIANAVNTKYSNSIFEIALLKHRQRLSDNSSRRKTWSTPDTDPIKL